MQKEADNGKPVEERETTITVRLGEDGIPRRWIDLGNAIIGSERGISDEMPLYSSPDPSRQVSLTTRTQRRLPRD